ncbi:ectoine/hydroxyectoine ABC transporter ATP-binding protein EhuA, partial [Siminovitchia sediminis]
DEVTSALDPELVGEVLNVIKDIAHTSNMTMILVTHEMDFAREISDRIVFIDKGKIVEQGPPKQVLENPKTDRLKVFLKRFHRDSQFS